MGLCCLMAIVEAVDGAIGQRKERNILDKTRVNAMAGKIKRGNCRHQARQLSRPDFNAVMVEFPANENKSALMSFTVFPGTLMVTFDDHVHALDNIAFMIILESQNALQTENIRPLFLCDFLDPWEEFICVELTRPERDRLNRYIMYRGCMIVVMMVVPW